MAPRCPPMERARLVRAWPRVRVMTVVVVVVVLPPPVWVPVPARAAPVGRVRVWHPGTRSRGRPEATGVMVTPVRKVR